jgi:PhnB protein
MSKVSIYLNFPGNAKEAFGFYKSVFGTEYSTPVTYMGEMPACPGMPPLQETEKEKIMHVSLPILGGVEIMGTDMLESMGQQLKIGNNTTINLQPDSREETDRLYKYLSEGSTECMPPQDMFWGDYWGVCLDKFGIRWMFNYSKNN